MTVVADALAHDTFYSAALRDGRSWEVFANCLHRHRTREAAEKCAVRIQADLANVPPPLWQYALDVRAKAGA